MKETDRYFIYESNSHVLFNKGNFLSVCRSKNWKIDSILKISKIEFILKLIMREIEITNDHIIPFSTWAVS